MYTQKKKFTHDCSSERIGLQNPQNNFKREQLTSTYPPVQMISIQVEVHNFGKTSLYHTDKNKMLTKSISEATVEPILEKGATYKYMKQIVTIKGKNLPFSSFLKIRILLGLVFSKSEIRIMEYILFTNSVSYNTSVLIKVIE